MKNVHLQSQLNVSIIQRVLMKSVRWLSNGLEEESGSVVLAEDSLDLGLDNLDTSREVEWLGGMDVDALVEELSAQPTSVNEACAIPLEHIENDCELLTSLDLPGEPARNEFKTKFVAQLKSDPTLDQWRQWADQSKNGYFWDKELMKKKFLTNSGSESCVLVVPKECRQSVLVLAHNNFGHMGDKKCKYVIAQKFTWPGMMSDIMKWCRSCVTCQKQSKVKPRRAPMGITPIATEPFESVAVDLVGPFPRSKSGYKYLLTMICLASRYPEALPLKSITADEVAEGLVELFCRHGVPRQLLSDQGK